MTEHSLAILWDMDGTIIDTKECHFNTWVYALKEHGFDLDREVYNANFGRNNHALLPVLLGFTPKRELYEKIVEEKEARFRELAPQEAPLVKGVESWLAMAKEAGFEQAVASSASMENIASLIKSYDLLGYFDVFVSGEDLPAKPEPHIFLETAKVLGKVPEQCLVIEDSLPGVKAAKRAGMKCIAVSTTHPEHQLSKADFVVEDFTIPLMDALRDLDLISPFST